MTHQKPICDKCGSEETLFEEYDAWACLNCNVWTEEKCNYEGCVFCPDRPDTPGYKPNEAERGA